MTPKEMSHLLKRTKKSCIKLIRKLSTKQIFLKRLEEEDISTDIDISVEAKERNTNENEKSSPRNTSYHHIKSEHKKDVKEKKNDKGKVLSQLEEEEEEDEETQNTAVLQSLTSKLFLTADGYEFQRLEQLRSDTASEILPYDTNFANATAIKKPTFADDTNLEIVFEKVKYKEDVRYLRHTPSTASLDNYFINDDIDYYITNHNNNINNNTTTNTTTTTFIHNNNCNMPNLNDPIFTNRGLETHRNFFNSQHHHHHLNTNLLPVNVSLGCKTDGNYHQFIIGEERDCFYKLTPVVKWDINGNSLEDDFDFNHFDMNANNSPTKSSLRSSSTTLETWLEDE